MLVLLCSAHSSNELFGVNADRIGHIQQLENLELPLARFKLPHE